MPGHVVLGGGSGFIGQNLSKILKYNGYGVTIITRNPKHQNEISWKQVETSGLPVATTAVVNLAGQNILDMKHRWTEDFKKLVWNSRIETTNLLSRTISHGSPDVNVFVVMSGVGIYEPIHKKQYTEDSKVYDFDFLSRMCLELEKSGKLATHCNCRSVVVRCGIVLGRDGGMIKNLYLPFSLGLGGPMSPGYQLLPWIHVKDLARLILYAIEVKSVKGVLNGVAPQDVTNAEFASAFGQALSRPAYITMPEFVLKMMFQDRSEMITRTPRVKPERVTSLGFKFMFNDINDACHEIVHQPKDPNF